MAGAIAYISKDTDGLHWKTILEPALGPIDFRTLRGGLGNKDDIEIALAWKPESGVLASLRNLKMVVSLGMGVDHLFSDDRVPPGVAVTRIMDDGLIGQMSEYAIYWALRHHRDIDRYRESQNVATWKVEPFKDTIHRRIGIMGLGTIGQDTAGKFAALGFPTAGWSRTAKTLPGIVDADLLAALDSGHLSGAALDVFNTEPLPRDHRYWTHPKVYVTPHVAGSTNPRTAAPGVIENIKRLRAGQPLINTVDPKTGY